MDQAVEIPRAMILAKVEEFAASLRPESEYDDRFTRQCVSAIALLRSERDRVRGERDALQTEIARRNVLFPESGLRAVASATISDDDIIVYGAVSPPEQEQR